MIEIEKKDLGRKICVIIFLDVAQVFDKVYHMTLMNKLLSLLSQRYVELCEYYKLGF